MVEELMEREEDSVMNTSQYEYGIPFDESQHNFTVIQGFHGPFGHQNGVCGPQLNLEYAIDLDLPLGTEVRAAREGIVRVIETRYNEKYAYSGTDNEEAKKVVGECRTNFAMLEHQDGECTLYCHLECGSELVQRQQYLEEGQPIARTGLSGYVGNMPNLHFQVHRWVRDRCKTILQTLPFRFQGYEGPYEHQELSNEIHRRRKNATGLVARENMQYPDPPWILSKKSKRVSP